MGAPISKGTEEKIRRLHRNKVPLKVIVAEAGVSIQTIYRVVYPERYRNRKRKASSEIKNALRTADSTNIKEDAMRLMERVPRDTRDLTARVLGDPLPGRSALDMKMNGGE